MVKVFRPAGAGRQTRGRPRTPEYFEKSEGRIGLAIAPCCLV